MGLNFPKGTKPPTSIFSHSEEFDQGLGRERPGQATATVSLDGTGDFDSIQEAIDFLPATGGVVFIKEGIYEQEDREIIIDKQNVTLQGVGKGTVIKRTSGTSNIISINKAEAVGFEGIAIRELRIVYEGIPSALVNGIFMFAVSDSIISNCWIENAGAFVINASDGGDNNTIDNCVFDESGDALMQINWSNSIISNNKINNAAVNAIVINSSSAENIIIGNSIDTAGESGIAILGDRNIVMGNNVKNCDDGILIFNGADRTNVVGNISLSNNTNFTDNGQNTGNTGNIIA